MNLSYYNILPSNKNTSPKFLLTYSVMINNITVNGVNLTEISPKLYYA